MTSILIALFALLVSDTSAFGGSSGRFESSHPNIDLSEAWKTLSTFFGEDMPSAIQVEFKSFPNGYSKFNCATKTVFINPKIGNPILVRSMIVHEGAHVVLCDISHEFNIDDRSRFWDEGMATILEHRFLKNEVAYKKRAHALAKRQAQLGNLNLSALKNWYSYSRDSQGKINGFAYGVGSSFDYYLLDTFGEAHFKSFLKTIGRSRSFSNTVQEVYGLSENKMTEDWLAYLTKTREQ